MRLDLITAAVLLAAALTACSKGGDAGGQASTVQAQTAETPTAEEVKALLASLPPPYNAGDIANGEAKEGLCRSCHTTAPGGPNMTGPNLHGVFGRAAGQTPGFRYSDALKASGITWDAARLDQWVADPHAMIPQTKMSFAGLKDPKDRVDLVAYLKVATR